jgi:hypothetical protein
MLERTTRPDEDLFVARLTGGPKDGAVVIVSAVAAGGPPDVFEPDDHLDGLYVLGGSPQADGTMPYLWSPRGTSDWLQERPATWTLISLDEQGRLRKIWHQHAEGRTPTPLTPESVDSDTVPAVFGRAWVCPECSEITVVSRPVAGGDPPRES